MESIELGGNEYGRLFFEYDGDGLCQFVYGGTIVGVLRRSFRISWVDFCPESIKRQCREFISGLLHGTISITNN